jgi:mannose-6-phosphate isomerase-like protein (cupin superfamily)
VDPSDVSDAAKRLVATGGGYEIVHESPGLELGVYVLVAPEPDRQQPHADDELYHVLDGSGTLEHEGRRIPIGPGDTLFVAAGEQHRFVDYDRLSLLVIFARPAR